MGNFYSVRPNEALVIRYGNDRKIISNTGNQIHGGWPHPAWIWVWWWNSDVKRLSLEVITLKPVCENVPSLEDVPITVTGMAQVKIIGDSPQNLDLAIQNFLGKEIEEVKKSILYELQGHLRALIGTWTPEQIHQDPDGCAELVKEVAGRDLSRMGIHIVSFNIDVDEDDDCDRDKTEISDKIPEDIDNTEDEPLTAIRKRH